MVYVPGSTGEMLKKPAPVAVRTVLTPVAVFVMVMVALGTTAPDESVTVPSMEPSPAVWLAAGRAAHPRQIANASIPAMAPAHDLPVQLNRSLFFVIKLLWLASFEMNYLGSFTIVRRERFSGV
jgi:hypothetical protein